MVRVLLRFPEEIVNQPIIAQTLLQHQIPLNIIAAHVDFHGGHVLIDIPREHVEKAVKAFKEKGVIVTFPKLIEVDREKCLNCGACYSLCPVGAIKIEKDYSVSFDMGKCIGSPCGLCVDACPARVIKLTREPSIAVQANENK
ncbi:4Fe-4S binding protein [Candidatus Bathyarchaeota archaeon]|nr:4Fe-4S binding protein [Candidatus Bathyarchaeota archaeon]